MKAQLSVKRELSKAKAPVVAHFGAAVEGIGMFHSSTTFVFDRIILTAIYQSQSGPMVRKSPSCQNLPPKSIDTLARIVCLTT